MRDFALHSPASLSDATAAFAGTDTAGLVLAADDLNSDIHANAEYRAHLCGVMLKQALATLA